MKPSAVCSICDHSTLGSGPRGRMASTGFAPHCRHCEALERHRVVHKLMRALPNGFLNWRVAIQFSGDPSMQAKWFRSLEISEYGGENSIDVQKIARADGCFDFISANHVLETVPDDITGFNEMARVLSPNGILQVTFGAIMDRTRTEDLVQPRFEWKTVHNYGRDVDERFRVRELGLSSLVVGDVDPCTGTREFVHFYFKSATDRMRCRQWIALWSDSASFPE
jgi:SAM-dependent methyltransferase